MSGLRPRNLRVGLPDLAARLLPCRPRPQPVSLLLSAAHLDTVELNADRKSRLPSEEQFAILGLRRCPDGFRFAVKAPDGIERRLSTFEDRVRCLGNRLGCVRVVVERPRDDGFLELLLGSVDPAIRYALDLRDPSWDGVGAPHRGGRRAGRRSERRSRVGVPALPRARLHRCGTRDDCGRARHAGEGRHGRIRVLSARRCS